MSAVVIKGIIISLSVVAAVGLALQSPEVREWLEEQRRKVAEMLRSMSEGLDPYTRSQAEAFAFEGRLPTQQEMQGISNATAIATGRESDVDTTRNRIQRQNSGPSVDAVERRRLGREYLAKRNQELLDLKNKRLSEMSEKSVDDSKTPAYDTPESAVRRLESIESTATFDGLINGDGTLKLERENSLVGQGQTKAEPSVNTQQPIFVPAAVRAFQSGSHFGNPFGDEFALSEQPDTDGAQTPRPPVPPKILPETSVPGSFPPDPPVSELPVRLVTPAQDTQNLSYDEQLARALSLSLAESEEQARNTLGRRRTEEEDLAMAIEDSLKEAERRSSNESSRGPLVDFSSDAPRSLHHPQMTTNPWQAKSEDEDLYSLTPMPTGSRTLAHPGWVAESLVSANSSEPSNAEPEAPASTTESSEYGSFQFSPSQTLSPIHVSSVAPPSGTISPELAPRQEGSTGFQSDSETESFASWPRSSAGSIGSLVEVEDVDIDSMSDDDDGIRTPQSWSEVGSEIADSERSESEAEDMVRV